MKVMQKSKTFTLIELILVIAIVAILAAAIIPVISRTKEKAKIAHILQLADTIREACQNFNADTGRYARENIVSGFHDLANDHGVPGWDGPYLVRELSPEDNPFYGGGAVDGIFLYSLFFGVSDYDLDGDGAIDRSGPGNYVVFTNITESVGKEINDMYDINVPGDWKHTGKIEYWSSGSIGVRIYLIGGS